MPDLLWPEFVGLVHRANREAARRFLTEADATSLAIAQALGGSKTEVKAARERIRKVAYPEDPDDIAERVAHLKRLEAEQAENG